MVNISIFDFEQEKYVFSLYHKNLYMIFEKYI